MPSSKPATPLTPTAAGHNPVRRAARAVLRWSVRCGGDRGGPWGEAVLAEFDGLVYRNGAALDEPYLPAGTYTECTPVTVPAGQVFLLGDHRDGAADSRHDGPWRLDDVTGRMVARLPT